MRIEALQDGPIAAFLADHSAKPNGTDKAADRPPLDFEPAWYEDVEPGIGSWLLKGILPKSGIGAIWGPPGSGKSFIALHLALLIALGADVLNARCNRSGVIYLAAEDPDGIRTRIAAWRQEHGSKQLPFLFVPAPVGFTAGNLTHVAALVDLAREQAAQFQERGAPVGLVIADTFARSLPGLDENSAPAMSDAIAKLSDLGRELNALVLIIHHAGKDASRGERGHSSLRAALDVSLEVVRDGDKRTLKLSKSKNAVDGLAWPFELKPVVLGVDQDGDDIVSCVAVIHDPTELAPKSSAAADLPALRKLPAQAEIVGRVIAAAIHEHGGLALEADVRPKGLSVLASEDNEHALKAAKQAWKRGVEKLIAERLLAREGGVLTMGTLAVARFMPMAVVSPSMDKRLAVLRNLILTAWQAGGCVRLESVPWVGRDAIGKPTSEIQAALAKGILDLEAAGDIEPDGEGFRILTPGLCPPEEAPSA